MLKPIPTVHPAIMLVSLAVIGALVYYSLHGALNSAFGATVALSIGGVCSWSLTRRKSAIDRK